MGTTGCAKFGCSARWPPGAVHHLALLEIQSPAEIVIELVRVID
jgi:hypothetical protein